MAANMPQGARNEQLMQGRSRPVHTASCSIQITLRSCHLITGGFVAPLTFPISAPPSNLLPSGTELSSSTCRQGSKQEKKTKQNNQTSPFWAIFSTSHLTAGAGGRINQRTKLTRDSIRENALQHTWFANLAINTPPQDSPSFVSCYLQRTEAAAAEDFICTELCYKTNARVLC